LRRKPLITTGIILFLAMLLAPILLIRFRKRWVAAFNLAVTNRVTSRFADRLPGFGILTHVGRKSGKVYRRQSMFFEHQRDSSLRSPTDEKANG
jgi:ABC-type transport system involved in cytochrome bd biosynthesis fused ATPase/permease subunit